VLDSQHSAEVKIAQINTSIPDMKGLPAYAAEEYFDIKNVDYAIKGNGSHILSQAQNSEEVQLLLGTLENKYDKLPNLKGLTVREALKRINFLKLRVKITGSGRVIRQSIQPGTSIKQKNELLLTCANN
jgi:hypothetical protein